MNRTFALRAALISAVFAAALGTELAAEPAKAGAQEGSEAPAWLVAGPYPFGKVGGLQDPLDIDYLLASGLSPSGEAAAAPLRVTSPGKASWREPNGATGVGVNFLTAFGPAADSVAYAYRDVYSDSARRVSLKLGSDDGVKVWVNGSLAIARHVLRALAPDDDAAAVDLVKGRNRVLVKVSQAQGDWGFALRILPYEEDAKAAASATILALAAYADELVVPPGGKISGVSASSPAFCSDKKARIELLAPSGKVLASASSSLGGRFELVVPSGAAGPLRLRASGLGELAGLAPTESAILVGDPLALARAAQDKARRAAAAYSPGAARAAADFPATMEFLAQVLEGGLPDNLGSFDKAAQALSQIEAMAASPSKALTGLARYAYRSGVDGSLQPYSLYVPSGYDGAKKYGLVLALHGATGNDYEMAASLAPAKPEDMLIASPFGRGDLSYSSTGERDVMDVLALVMASYAIDPDRVYITGRSMGGYGAWRLGRLYPGKFAAIASFAGWTDVQCLENLSTTPVLAVHGDADDVISIGSDARAVELLKSMGASVRFDIIHGAGHDALGAWTAKEGPQRLFDWFRPLRRAAWPQSIKVRTTEARTGEGKWASILGLSLPLSISALDARIVDSRHIVVDTQNVAAFALDLRHPSLAKTGRILINADGINLTADALSPAARFELGDDGAFAAASSLEAAGGADGLAMNEGTGYAALFDGPLRIVYGTQKRGQAADNEAIARALGDWIAAYASSTGRPAIPLGGPGSFAVVPDTSIGPAEEAASSLFLVGWPEDNSVLARVASRLPVALKAGKATAPAQGVSGMGVVFVCPSPDAPGRLMGVLAPPSRGKATAALARSMITPVLLSSQYEPCGFGAPDVLLLDKAGQVSWAGYFDWRWRKLRPSGSGK